MSDILTTAANDAAVTPATDAGEVLVSVQHWPARALGAALSPARDRRGITTVEYVIGIIAGITLVGVLILALTNPSVQQAIVGLVTHIFGEGNAVRPGVPSGGKS